MKTLVVFLCVLVVAMTANDLAKKRRRNQHEFFEQCFQKSPEWNIEIMDGTLDCMMTDNNGSRWNSLMKKQRILKIIREFADEPDVISDMKELADCLLQAETPLESFKDRLQRAGFCARMHVKLAEQPLFLQDIMNLKDN